MKMMKTLLLCALMLTANVARADRIRADYDRSAGFYKYETFMWVTDSRAEKTFLNDQIMKAVCAELQARGLRLVSANGDLVVSAQTSMGGNRGLDNYYASFAGGWNWYHFWAPEPSITVMETLEFGTLAVELFDTRAERVVWWATGTEIDKHLFKTVGRMFEYFPPDNFIEERSGYYYFQ